MTLRRHAPQVLAAVLLAVGPTIRLSAQDSLPVGFGTLKRDDIVVRFDTPELEIQFLPLEQSVTRLLAPDTYRSLQDRLRSKRGEIDDLARRAGLLRPVLAMVSFFGLVQRSEEHTSELQSLAYLVCRLLLEKKKKIKKM